VKPLSQLRPTHHANQRRPACEVRRSKDLHRGEGGDSQTHRDDDGPRGHRNTKTRRSICDHGRPEASQPVTYDDSHTGGRNFNDESHSNVQHRRWNRAGTQ